MTDSGAAILPTFFIPHGGGPCFFMQWNPPETWLAMGNFLTQLSAQIEVTPRAIVVISGHWETPEFSLTAGAAPPLIYDYFGFPEHTYALQYPVPGSVPLAQEIGALLAHASLPLHFDGHRGFDHGVFIPFKLIYPDASIPIVQVSLQADLDPASHLALGAALAPLRERGVLIVGSGMSYHNMRGVGAGVGGPSDQFDAWLTASVALDSKSRDAALTHWQDAPGARIAHPREEHLLPLMVVAGAAGLDPGQKIYSDRIMGASISAYRFG